jgi:riboflavin kinase/FMN adenylyltransferase
MIIYRSIDEITAPLQNPVVTIGNFDGVHLGHREMFRRLKESAAEIGGVSVVVTFDPHPLRVVASGKSIALINTLEEKVKLIAASGLDYLLIIPFEQNFANVTATEFVEQILVDRIGVRRLLIGYDYAFGKGREGNVELLRQLGEKLSFRVDVLAPISVNGTIYSSSLIRTLIREGNVGEVVLYLGRHFSIGGRVVHGRHRGKTLGFPTANIVTDKELVPADGVYAVKVRIGAKLYDGACNIGNNPTFADGQQSIEAFVFDFDGELYGQDIRLYFIERVRDEQRFSSTQDLVEAISADVRRCREILASTPLVVYQDYLEGI